MLIPSRSSHKNGAPEGDENDKECDRSDVDEWDGYL